ncbi:olfactory receptor 5J3-like [Ambystoma mexicanum]|uniref:olfactory receptor 5J3-like n=1 Tax=Ambystoma mexicanum TaxID=8296 RepID=UPI0037E81D83
MGTSNCTSVTVFILLGFTDLFGLQPLMFLLFLALYVIALLGNIGMILAIWMTPRLATPMYFFLLNLSILDLCYSSAISPQMLSHLLAEDKSISFGGCVAQMYIFVMLGTSEALLLGVMAYDRFVAICSPLRYTLIMTRALCAQLVAGVYGLGTIQSLVQTCLTFQLPFCYTNQINHFFCDVPPLLKASSADVHMNELVLFVLGSLTEVGSILVILVSYAYIISAILKITSTSGRQRTFSTCASHLTVVCLFYGTIFFMYLRPPSISFRGQDQVVSVVYTVVIPVLNPLIYSLRNKEVKQALRTSLPWKQCTTKMLTDQ